MTAHNPELSGAVWRKSTRSSSSGQNCVEIAANLPGIVAVRDSKDPSGPKLVISLDQWSAFVSGVLRGDSVR
jgi:hypothetical protein